MRLIAYALAVFSIASRRLWHQRGLALSMLLGLTSAVGLTTSVPIYADAVSARILDERLHSDPERVGPPYSFLLRYVGSWRGYLEWEDTRPVDAYITQLGASTLGLPLEVLVRHFKTDQMRLFPISQAQYSSSLEPLAYVEMGFVSDLESHINIVDGQFPRPVMNDTDPIEVLVTVDLVGQLGIDVGEEYDVYYEGAGASESTAQTVFQRPVRVAGIWQARDPSESFWFYPQSAFAATLLVPEASFVQLSQGMKGEVGLALWSLVCDGSGVSSRSVDPLLGRIAVLRNKVNGFLNGTDIAQSPEDALTSYRHTLLLLTSVLYAFSIPILGLVLYFISLVSGMVVRQQRNEVAMLRSRGTTAGQVVGVYVLEGLIVGVLAVVVGALVGERVAQVMGFTRSFLALQSGWGLLDRAFWTTGLVLPHVFSWDNLRLGLLALGVAVLASVMPAANAARDTVVTYKQDQSRSLRRPFWQRAYLDLFLLIPAGYGYYLLRRRGTISFLQTGDQTASPFTNPYLFLVPVLLVCSLSLLWIRLVPLLMRLLAWLAGAWRGAVPVLALRHLARSTHYHVGPMLLLVLTLSLAVFSSSMAQTLDDHTQAAVYYDLGADFRLVEIGESTRGGSTTSSETDNTSSQAAEEPQGPDWLFLPVSEHLNVPGVQQAARVWAQQVTIQLGEQSEDAMLMGIDRLDFPKVAFFRRDFAPASLGALMNALAVRDDAILVSRQVLDSGLGVGDMVEIPIPIGSAPKVKFTVAGVVDLFPRLYAQEGAFFVANLDYIFNSAGGLYPYDVWLKTDPSLNTESLLAGAKELGIPILQAFGARREADKVLLRPERKGVFGLLSVGFVASALLTVVGFLIYSYVSFSQRYIELGVLRAIGLSVGQMGAFLVVEQLILIALGVAAGTGLGVWTSSLFIPFYHVQIGRYIATPPMVVQIAWREVFYVYAVLAAMFLTAVAVLFLSLRRLRIFEAVKLGETT